MPIGCLLYKDFEEAWFGGSAIDVAWGQHPSGNQLDLDYDAEESIELYGVYPIRCMEDSFNTAKLPEQYRRKYWSGWDWSDFGENHIARKSNTGLFLICGAVKFGSGSAYGRMTTPALGQYGLSGVSDIVVSFEACTYTDPHLTVAQLAKYTYTSREHLSRVFKEYTLESIHGYLTNLRMQHCRNELADGTGVLDACTASGFANYSSFLKSFRALYGITPAEYRAQLRQSRRTP